MKPRTVIVLAVVVAALAAFLWFVDRDLPSSEERAEQSKKILPIDAQDVSELTVEWQGKSVRMEKGAPPAAAKSSGSAEASGSAQGQTADQSKAGGGQSGAAAAPSSDVAKTWRIVAPLEARADGTQVDRLLEALGALERTRVIKDADPAAVGLDKPRGQVTLKLAEAGGKSGGERTLRVGDAVPTSDDILVSVSSGDGPAETYVTSGSFLSQLQRAPGDWRDKDVFTATRNTVERLTLTAAGSSPKAAGAAASPIVLARRDERFRIEQPVSDVADPKRMDDLLSGLVSLRVKHFLDPSADGSLNLTEKGLDPPRQTLEANLQGGETFRLDLGDPVPDQGSSPTAGAGTGTTTVYAKVGDQVFTAATDLPKTLGLSASAWRSPEWTAVKSFQVERLGVTRGKTSFDLRRDGVDWKRADDTIPYEKASDLLSAVTGAEGAVVDGAKPATPLLTLKLTPQDGDPVTLSLYPAASDGSHLAGCSDRTALVRLSKETASGILDAVTAVRDAKPEKAPGDGADGASAGSEKGAGAKKEAPEKPAES